MPALYSFILFFISTVSFPLLSSDIGLRVLYGEDDRVEAKDFIYSRHYLATKSVAGMVDLEYLGVNTQDQRHFMNFWVNSIQSDFLLCDGVRFEEQPSLANCTGFLVGDDLLVTAGHCVKPNIHSNKDKCKDFVWIFDYSITSDAQPPFSIVFPNENVYRCSEIVEYHFKDSHTDAAGHKIVDELVDYAVIKLDRKVKGRAPLKLRKSSESIKDNDPLFVIGHPWGLPLKVATNAKVLDNSNPMFFTANLDTFGSNSGSPVFNYRTGDVEGIVVRGKPDLYSVVSERCRIINRCNRDGSNCYADNDLSAEHVMRMSKVLIP